MKHSNVKALGLHGKNFIASFLIVLYSSKYFIIQNKLFEKGRDFCGHLENHTIRAHSYYLILGSDNYSSSEEERDNSRPPMWSKYPLDVQKEFDYDSPHDLDSD